MKYPGIYRGYVVSNNDTESENTQYLGRIKVNVPEVYGEVNDDEALPWAWPCMPFFGGGSGDYPNICFAVPPVGSTVWVMFEKGECNYPVYMGTWIGKTSELPVEAKSFSEQGRSADYPMIFLIKAPWGDAAFFRIAGNKQMELVFQDMSVKLKGETSDGADDRQIDISSTSADIRINSTEGEVSISGKVVNIDSENNMNIRAGRYKLEGEKVVVDTEGSLSIQATKNQRIHAERIGKIQSGDDGGWFLVAENASGFERHGGVIYE